MLEQYTSNEIMHYQHGNCPSKNSVENKIIATVALFINWEFESLVLCYSAS